MTGVFSLWTGTPAFEFTRALACLYSAAIAYGCRSFNDTELVTDVHGLEIADRLGWDVTSFSLALQDFCPLNARHIWMLGKIEAQLVQTKPHAHIDLDFLVYHGLPKRLREARVGVQSKDNPYTYQTDYVMEVMRMVGIHPHTVAFNTALMLWNDMELCREYCERSKIAALTIAETVGHGGIASIVCEQSMLAHIMREKRIRVECAVPMPSNCYEADFEDVPFSHLWGRSKGDVKWLEAVERRFADEFPARYAAFDRGFRQLQESGTISTVRRY